MKTLLLVAALMALPVHAEEPRPANLPPQTTSEKVRLRLLETAPPPAKMVARPGPVKKNTPKPESDPDEVVVLHPLIVRESYAQREFNAYMEREQKRAAAERFDPIKGGTLYQSKDGRMQIGAWGGLGGWTLLKFKW